MNKHEIEALRGLIAQWRKQAEEYFSEGDELGSAASNDDANDLEKLLDSLPAPDDGLREGLEQLRTEWEKVIEYKREDGGYEASCIASTLVLVNGELKKLLNKTPDGWQPIADAPRDGRWLIVTNAEDVEEEGPLALIHWCKVLEKWQDWTGYVYKNTNLAGVFTHYREKPAPPREGKG